MNSTQRQGVFLICIPVVIATGIGIFKWTAYECLILLSLFALVMKLTDIEERITEVVK